MASARFRDIAIFAVPMWVGMAGLIAMRWRLNILSMGDREAQGLAILFATLATAGAVCVSGVIGWVGLVVPHMGRMLVGNNNTVLVPVSLSIGAGYLIPVDNVARTLTGSEIPSGISTLIIGAPFFIYLPPEGGQRGNSMPVRAQRLRKDYTYTVPVGNT
jgi:iron complex transport system permease protein